MGRLILTESQESILAEELERLRKLDAECQNYRVTMGYIKKMKAKSDYALLISAIEAREEKITERIERLKSLMQRSGIDVGSEHIRADGQYKSPDAQQALCIHYEMHEK